jgi:hypothetical protein
MLDAIAPPVQDSTVVMKSPRSRREATSRSAEVYGSVLSEKFIGFVSSPSLYDIDMDYF